MSGDEHAYIRSGHHVILKLPSGILKPLEIQPDKTVNIGKFGSFLTNSLIGRPYYLTFEISDEKTNPILSIVPASELNSEKLLDVSAQDDENVGNSEPGFDIVGEDGEVIMRNNRLTVDDPSRQALTVDEIEELKKAETGSGRDVIAKIMAAHSAIGEKTNFSLAKYTLRKSRKYLKRFTVLPADLKVITELMLEKDAPKIMDLRVESLGLLMSWANVHHMDEDIIDGQSRTKPGRVLVVDDTSGLVVAAIAERMGVLHAAENKIASETTQSDSPQQTTPSGLDAGQNDVKNGTQNDEIMADEMVIDATQPPTRRPHPREAYQAATTNTITVVHAQNQPNLALLKYWGYNLEDTSPSSPLFSHIRTMSWLQVLEPDADALYTEKPEEVTPEEMECWKTGKKGNYFKKLRRWQRVKNVVDDTRAGGFDALIVASHMNPAGILKHLVPLVRGGGQVVVYSPNIEPLSELADLYSRERRGAYLKTLYQKWDQGDETPVDEDEDFPVDPTLLLQPMLQTSRAIEWQVLPGRTHPLMTSRGGPEGYLFTATRVIPHEGPVAARGKFGKKRKAEGDEKATAKKPMTESDATAGIQS